MVKMRKAVLRDRERDGDATTDTLRQGECRSICANIIAVTMRIRLERMLLHSGATSSSRSGRFNTSPSRETGVPDNLNRISDAQAEVH